MKRFWSTLLASLVITSLNGLDSTVNARRTMQIFLNEPFQAQEEEQEWKFSHAYHARQLVHKNEWATLSTLSVQFGGVPYGSIVSYSDGEGYSKEASTGNLFFYITPMDAAGKDLSHNSTASVTITEAQEGIHACKMDVEDPTCWKVTLIGTVVPVPLELRQEAEKALFSKHPQMKHWPRKHGFIPYVLKIEHIILLDYYGGAKHIPVKKYYEVKL